MAAMEATTISMTSCIPSESKTAICAACDIASIAYNTLILLSFGPMRMNDLAEDWARKKRSLHPFLCWWIALDRIGSYYLDFFVCDSAIAVNVCNVIHSLTVWTNPNDVFLANCANCSWQKILSTCSARYFVTHFRIFSNS